MRGNRVVVVALALVAGIAGCASQPHEAPKRNAQVTVDGKSQKVHNIECSQLQEYRTIDIGDESAGLEATVAFDGTTIKPQWVKFRNFGGFTGSFWQGGAGSANASLSGGTFTIAGTAYGVTANDPKPATENFKIVGDCG